MYEQINRIIPKLRHDEDFTLDEKSRTATLTDDGVVHCEEILGLNNLFDPANIVVLLIDATSRTVFSLFAGVS